MILCPSMNTWMWRNPSTKLNLLKIRSFGSIDIIPPIAKRLMCGDVGVGAMEEPSEIAVKVKDIIACRAKVSTGMSVISTGLALIIFGNLGRALYRMLRAAT